MSQAPSMSPAVYTSDLERAFPRCSGSKTHPGSFLNLLGCETHPAAAAGARLSHSHLHGLRAPPGPPVFLLLLQGKPESV